jgi:hypothetical protein
LTFLVGGFGLEEAPGTKEELLRQLLVAEVSWACGTTTAHGVLRGGAVWAWLLGFGGVLVAGRGRRGSRAV